MVAVSGSREIERRGARGDDGAGMGVRQAIVWLCAGADGNPVSTGERTTTQIYGNAEAIELERSNKLNLAYIYGMTDILLSIRLKQ